MRNRNLDAQVDLIAFISLLAVLICSLLLTSIWLQINSINVKQAVGASSDKSAKPMPTAWVQIDSRSNLSIRFQNVKGVPKALRSMRIQSKSGKIDSEKLGQFFNRVTKQVPNMGAVFFKPSANVAYEVLIQAMDKVKEQGVLELAVVPL